MSYININSEDYKLIDIGLNYGEINLYCMIKSYFENSQDFKATNKYLSEFFHTSQRNIQLWMKKLIDKDLIYYQYENGQRFVLPKRRNLHS